MEEENEQDVDLNNEEEEVEESEPEIPKEKPKRSPEEQLAYLEGRTQRLRKKLGLVEPRKARADKPSELDETQLDYLDLKGISDPDEIEVIKNIVTKTGQTVRQALKDDYVVAKLESLRKDKAVKDATPSATKRGGNQTNDLATAIARFDQTGELPTDYQLKSQVVNAIEERASTNKPAWH